METLGERIVNARNKKGFSQEKFAEELGVSRQMVSRWELNLAVPRMSRMEKICELLDLTANELIYGKVIDEAETNQNDSQESVAERYKSLKFKAFLKRTAIISLKVIVILFILYVTYSLYKFIVLKHVIKEVSKYENLDNYYCNIVTHDENEMDTVKEIWYKDGMYKIIDTTKINETDVKATLIVDLNNECRYQVDDNTKTARKRNLMQMEQYQNGRVLYDSFPIEIRNSCDYVAMAFKVNKVFYYKKDNKYYLEINDTSIQLDKNTYLPMTSTIKQKKQKEVKKDTNRI